MIKKKKGCAIMKIQAVLIDGFKNLSKVKINFDKITALVALNNFGKSNVLSGIDFGLDFIKANYEDKINMMSNINLIPINKNTMGTNYRFEMETLTEINKKEYRIVYGYQFSWRYNEKVEPKIVEEYLKVKLEEKGQKYTKLINRTNYTSLYKSSETGRCSSKIKVEDAELVINKLRAYDYLYYIDIIKKLNSMKFYMENNLDAKSFYAPDPIIRKDLKDLILDADNLPRVIYKLKSTDLKKFQLLKYVYMQLFPNIQDIIVKQFKLNEGTNNELPKDAPFIISNSIYLLYVQDKNLNNIIDFAMMSDGAKRVFMILAKIILANSGDVSLIAIEEPENSIHPSLFQSYITIISQLLDNCKVIITSHSPYIISYLNPAWIHVGVNRQPGVAEFFSFKKSGQNQLQQNANDLNMSIGDYLFSMLAEDDSNVTDYLECNDDE